jgi:hypothetical protein
MMRPGGGMMGPGMMGGGRRQGGGMGAGGGMALGAGAGLLGGMALGGVSHGFILFLLSLAKICTDLYLMNLRHVSVT